MAEGYAHLGPFSDLVGTAERFKPERRAGRLDRAEVRGLLGFDGDADPIDPEGFKSRISASEQARCIWQDRAVVARTITFLTVRDALRLVGLGPRPTRRMSKSRCCATSWRSWAGRSQGRATGRTIG